MKFNLRLLYLYLFSFVGLLITIIGSIQLLDLALKTYVFKVTDYPIYAGPVIDENGKALSISSEDLNAQKTEESNQRKRQISNSLAMIMVATPVYLYHWATIKKESKKQ